MGGSGTPVVGLKRTVISCSDWPAMMIVSSPSSENGVVKLGSPCRPHNPRWSGPFGAQQRVLSESEVIRAIFVGGVVHVVGSRTGSSSTIATETVLGAHNPRWSGPCDAQGSHCTAIRGD